VLPGHLEAFLEAITANARRSFTDEPGCVSFDVSQDASDDHHFIFYELYQNMAALEAHRSASHFATWRRAAEQHVVPGSQLNVIANRLIHHSEVRA
jgi:quinol monooxygenase YgiN